MNSVLKNALGVVAAESWNQRTTNVAGVWARLTRYHQYLSWQRYVHVSWGECRVELIVKKDVPAVLSFAQVDDRVAGVIGSEPNPTASDVTPDVCLKAAPLDNALGYRALRTYICIWYSAFTGGVSPQTFLLVVNGEGGCSLVKGRGAVSTKGQRKRVIVAIEGYGSRLAPRVTPVEMLNLLLKLGHALPRAPARSAAIPEAVLE